jgi:CBS domain-containing protein
MKARDVMTSPAVAVRPHMSVRAVAALLVSHGYTAAPVVDAEGCVRGIVTEADLLRGRVTPEESPDTPGPDVPVSTVMMPAPVLMGPEDDLTTVVEVMLHRGVRTVPIVERGHLIGIITRRDVLRGVAGSELADVRSAARRAVRSAEGVVVPK